jgi:RNA polymerase sigma factor (sigma-70 family)
MSESTTTAQLESCLVRLRAGDARAHDDLWRLVDDRLTALTRKMLRESFSRLKQWEQTDDVAQNAKVRLLRAIEEVAPTSVRDFYGLAGLQIRRELHDRIRHLTGRDGQRVPPQGMVDGSDGSPMDVGGTTYDPVKLGIWDEFHRAVAKLPPELREIWDIHWYQELSLAEAAVVLGVDLSTAKRRWRQARLALAPMLPGGELPAT